MGHIMEEKQWRIICKSLICILAGLLVYGCTIPVEAGNLGKSLGSAAMTRIFKQDLKNHATTKAKPLAHPRTVHRYTTRVRGKREASIGLAPNTHMTARAKPGRPLSPRTAQRRYGLAYSPQVRETIHLPKGFSVRHNKVVGGAPGVGEITSPLTIPAIRIRRIVPLRNGK